MDTSFEQKIREKAYEIWQAAGMQEGMAHEHWASAEQAVLNEAETPKAKIATAVKKSAAKAAAPKAAAAKKSAKAKATTKH